MISIQTNLSSIILQQNLANATKVMNQALERMSTGYRINRASDNPAGYAIVTDMTTKLNAYYVAEDNVASGIDFIATANDIISLMQDKASKLYSLSTQARNGTYGASSLASINSEANAIMAEINRLYMTTQYNGIDLFSQKAYTIASHLPQAGSSGFIDESAVTTMPEAKAEYNGFIQDPVTYTDAEVQMMPKLELVNQNISSGTYSISTVDELKKLAIMVEQGKITGGEFVLANDIDLSSFGNWTPIGNSPRPFQGTFDGNGHVIKNLKINNPVDFQGLFGCIATNSIIQNIGIINADVIGGGNEVGGLVGRADGLIKNSYVKGDVSGAGRFVGWLVGASNNKIDNSYATGNVSGYNHVGGLVGSAIAEISNSYATGNVSGNDSVGGLAGYTDGGITNSYATGNVTGNYYVGGLAGQASGTITNSYATGNVSGNNSVGGLVGNTDGGITNSYATGNVSGIYHVGGLAGNAYGTITNSYATGNVVGSDRVGGLAGNAWNTITNSYATGNVVGNDKVGGLAGLADVGITNSYATGNVTGNEQVGGLAGYAGGGITNSYATGNVTGNYYVGGLAGQVYATSGISAIQDSVSYSKVYGQDVGTTGSFIGMVVNTYNNINFGTLNITNSQSIAQDINKIGGVYHSNGGISGQPDTTAMIAGITDVAIRDISTKLQVGIYGDSSSQISFDTNFDLKLNLGSGIESDRALKSINELLDILKEKSTQLGSVQNRLDSALDSIAVSIENLTSSRSTIRDADMTKESSIYIQQQILQEAAATLLATANQTPAIALQLI